MRIVHVITGLGQGGAESALINLCRDMRSVVEETTVISLGAGSENAEPLRKSGALVHELEPGSVISATVQLRRRLAEIRPDVVHCWMYHPLLLSPLFASRFATVAGIRASLQSIATERMRTRAIIRACAISSRFVDALVYNSSVGAEEHARIGYATRRSRIIPNGISMADFSPNPRAAAAFKSQLGIAPHEFVIGHAGRYHPVKNQLGLIDAAGALASLGRRFRLVLAGTGMDRSNTELLTALDSAGIAERAILLGPVRPVSGMLGICDLFVNASISEAFPNIVAEAMAMAVPVVATNAGESAAIVGNSGFITSGHRSTDLASSIDSAMSLPRGDLRAMGLSARARVEGLYSQAAVTKAYLDVYRDARGRE